MNRFTRRASSGTDDNPARVEHVSERRVVASAVGVTTLSALPAFLLGSLQTYIRVDTGITASQMGIVIGTAFGVATVTSWPAGRIAGLMPERTAMVLAGSISATALAIVAVFPTSMVTLLLAAAIAGIGVGGAQPPANAAIAQHVALERRGLIFGVKQSSIPAGTLLAGLAVPIFGETVGWRWAFAAAMLLLPTALLAPRSSFDRPKVPPGWFGGVDRPARRQMVLLASAGALGSASANAMGIFLIDWTVVNGGTAVQGARLATIGSVCGIVTRIAVGALGDRLRNRVYQIVLVQLVAGAIGFALIAGGSFSLLSTLGVILAFAGGWGWTGLLAYIVTSLAPANPAAATGLSQFGVLLGGGLGPTLLGFAFASDRPAFGWYVCAAAGALAALLVLSAALIGRDAARSDSLAASPG